MLKTKLIILINMAINIGFVILVAYCVAFAVTPLTKAGEQNVYSFVCLFITYNL